MVVAHDPNLGTWQKRCVCCLLRQKPCLSLAENGGPVLAGRMIMCRWANGRRAFEDGPLMMSSLSKYVDCCCMSRGMMLSRFASFSAILPAPAWNLWLLYKVTGRPTVLTADAVEIPVRNPEGRATRIQAWGPHAVFFPAFLAARSR